MTWFKKHWGICTVGFLVFLYIAYFSYFTILRYKTLYASYFDLGIMHQTVYNTYQAIIRLDPGRFLELTNPYGPAQIKRMAIHNDILLAFIAPFYFIHAGPETLLVIQTLVLGLGAFAVYGIVREVLRTTPYVTVAGVVFSFAYLMYTPMQRANIFEFHAVTLATTFLLCMFYFFLRKRYRTSLVFFALSILSKEQVALTTFFFGIYAWYCIRKTVPHGNRSIRPFRYPLAVIAGSLVWFAMSMAVIIPYFRGGNHFALTYYADFGDSPLRVILGVLKNPVSLAKYIWHIDTLRYFLFLLGPLAFLAFFSPVQLLIATPEFGINLLSNSWNMRNIIYHYTSVLQPFVFIASVYGLANAAAFLKKRHVPVRTTMMVLLVALFSSVMVFSYLKGPLPFSREADLHPFLYPQKEKADAALWQKTLRNSSLKIAATGHFAPLFSSRRYFYAFSKNYGLADYLVLSVDEVYNYPERDVTIPVYEKLQKDARYRLIYKNENTEVYKKVR